MKSAQKRKRSGGSQKGHKEREREREVGAKLQTQKLGAKEKTPHSLSTLNSTLKLNFNLNSQLTQARFVTQREREVGEKRPKEEEKWGLSKAPQRERERERSGSKAPNPKTWGKRKKHTTLNSQLSTLNSQLSTLNSQLTQARFVTQREREVGEKRPKEEEKWGLSKAPQRERERERSGSKAPNPKTWGKRKNTTLTLNSQLSTLNSQLSTLNSQLTQARFVTQKRERSG